MSNKSVIYHMHSWRVVIVRRSLFALMVLLFFGALIYAAPVGVSNVTAGTPVTLGSASAGTAQAWGGNITQVNFTINSTTLHWQAFYGTITAGIRLASSSGTVKSWTVSSVHGMVYVSQSSNVDFSSLNSTAVSLANVDSAFSFLSGADDSAANTGTNSANPQFNVSQYQVAINSRPLITTRNGAGVEAWKQVVLNDGNTSNQSRYVFAAFINASGTAYDNSSAQYQVIVPDNAAGDVTPTTYYFYGEIQ